MITENKSKLPQEESEHLQKTHATAAKTIQEETICDCEPEMTDDFFENV